MSIFENSSIDAEDAALILDAAASYVLAYNRRSYTANPRLLLPFWHPRLMEKGILINVNNLRRHAPIAAVLERISERSWNGSPDWDRDFFEGFFSASATVYRRQGLWRAELSSKPRYREFLEGGLHGQAIRLIPHVKKSLMRTSSMYFMEIKPPGNLENNLRGVFSGGRPIRYGSDLWASVRGGAKPVLDRLGIVYEQGTKNALLLSPFYIALFNDEMPEPIASFWKREIGTENHRNAMIVAWMHWEQMFGRGKRRFLDGFPYLKSPQGSNRFGLTLDEIRKKMRDHRFDHVDSRIANRLLKWMERKKEEYDGPAEHQTAKPLQ